MLDEFEEAEKYKRLYKDRGNLIIIAAILGFLIGFLLEKWLKL